MVAAGFPRTSYRFGHTKKSPRCTAAEGSATLRNGPDVSANANFTYYVCADQTTCTANEYGGTSFAAPCGPAIRLWPINRQKLMAWRPWVYLITPFTRSRWPPRPPISTTSPRQQRLFGPRRLRFGHGLGQYEWGHSDQRLGRTGDSQLLHICFAQFGFRGAGQHRHSDDQYHRLERLYFGDQFDLLGPGGRRDRDLGRQSNSRHRLDQRKLHGGHDAKPRHILNHHHRDGCEHRNYYQLNDRKSDGNRSGNRKLHPQRFAHFG